MTKVSNTIPLSKINKMTYKDMSKLIDKARLYLKQSDTIKELFEDNNVPLDIIDNIPIIFKDIDTSAKTEGGIIYLSYKLLKDGNFYKDYSYLAHEITHFIQQCFGNKPTKSGNEKYLDNKYEVDGFKQQVKFIEEEFGSNKAEDYTDELLQYHNYKKNKSKKKEELLSDTQMSSDK